MGPDGKSVLLVGDLDLGWVLGYSHLIPGNVFGGGVVPGVLSYGDSPWPSGHVRHKQNMAWDSYQEVRGRTLVVGEDLVGVLAVLGSGSVVWLLGGG